MRSDIAKFLAALIASFCVLGVIMYFLYLAEHRSCTDSWKDSGNESKYGFFSGCLVKLPNGSWVPSQSVKTVLPLTNKAN